MAKSVNPKNKPVLKGKNNMVKQVQEELALAGKKDAVRHVNLAMALLEFKYDDTSGLENVMRLVDDKIARYASQIRLEAKERGISSNDPQLEKIIEQFTSANKKLADKTLLNLLERGLKFYVSELTAEESEALLKVKQENPILGKLDQVERLFVTEHTLEMLTEFEGPANEIFRQAYTELNNLARKNLK